MTADPVNGQPADGQPRDPLLPDEGPPEEVWREWAGFTDEDRAALLAAEAEDRANGLTEDPEYKRAVYGLGSGSETTAPAVRFVTPDELRSSTPAEPPWRWHGYLAEGALTVLSGKPKAGKSTLGLALAHAIGDGARSFLGHAIEPSPVVYVSEEGGSTLAHKVAGDQLRIATRETAWPRPDWPSLVAAAHEEAQRVGAAVVVIDTFAFWAGLPAESEKDAGAMQAAMEPLVAVARDGIAALLIVHSRKGGGDDGEAVRGSSALAGAADIVLELERLGKDSPRERKLLALSRYPQTPGVLVIGHDPREGSWSVIGEGTDRGDARDIANRGALLDALDYDEDLTRADLEEATGKPAREWHGTLEQLIEDGLASRSGEGRKGDPYRYRKLREGAAQHPRRNGDAAGADSGAHPVGVHHQHHDAAPLDDSAGCAESSLAEADDELDRLAEKFPDLAEDGAST